MNRWVLVGGVLLIAVVYGALASSGQRRTARAPEGPGQGDDYVELHAQLPAAEPAQPPVRAPDPSAQPAADPAAAAEDTPTVAPALPDPVRGHGPTLTLHHAFTNEPRDAHWADGEEQAIRELFIHDELPDGLVQSAACRQSVCRFEVRWPSTDSSGYRTFKDLITGRWGGIIGIDYPDNSRQTRSLIVYVPRQGYTLEDVAAGQPPKQPTTLP